MKNWKQLTMLGSIFVAFLIVTSVSAIEIPFYTLGSNDTTEEEKEEVQAAEVVPVKALSEAKLLVDSIELPRDS